MVERIMKPRFCIIAAGILWGVIVAIGCTTAPEPEDTYVADYQVVDNRTVKYLYLTGERSLAGSSYGDQALALELCSVEREFDEDTGEKGDVVETDCERTRLLKTEEYR